MQRCTGQQLLLIWLHRVPGMLQDMQGQPFMPLCTACNPNCDSSSMLLLLLLNAQRHTESDNNPGVRHVHTEVARLRFLTCSCVPHKQPCAGSCMRKDASPRNPALC